MMKLTRRNFIYASWILLSAVAISGCLDPVKALFKKPRGKREPLFRQNPYIADGKSLVAVAGEGDVKNMVREAVSMLGGFEKTGIRNKTVLVKPNVVSSRRNPTTTNPELVRAVVSLLYEEGASTVYVGDMSALRTLPTSRNMKKTGIGKAAAEAGARVLFLEDYDYTTVTLSKARYIKEVAVSDWIFKVDRIINLPVVKTHRSARYSICMKNLIGTTHAGQRPYLVDVKHWEEIVAEINLAYRPDLNIVDGTTIMVEGGPWSGEARRTNCVIASGDRIAADIVGLGLIKAFGLSKHVAGRNVWDMGQIRRAVEAGIGARNAGEMELRARSLTESSEFQNLIDKVRRYMSA